MLGFELDIWDYLTFLTAFVAGVVLNGLAFAGSGGVHDSIRFVPLVEPSQYPEAIELGAILHVCAENREALASFITSRGFEFDPKLVRKKQGLGVCHIYYEPTLPGFRASRDDAAAIGPMGSTAFAAAEDSPPIGESGIKATDGRSGRIQE